jgi:hypothetical protein
MEENKISEDDVDKMTAEDGEEDEIDVASDEAPILTRSEPEFRRFFARGSLLRVQDYDDETVQLGFWSFKDEEIPIEEEDETATGYRLEAEAMMTWSTANRLRKLLDNYIEEHAPEEYSRRDD